MLVESLACHSKCCGMSALTHVIDLLLDVSQRNSYLLVNLAVTTPERTHVSLYLIALQGKKERVRSSSSVTNTGFTRTENHRQKLVMVVVMGILKVLVNAELKQRKPSYA